MLNSALPDFAAAWIAQWKQAAPRLQAIRDEELRRLDSMADVGRHETSKGTRQEETRPLIFDRNPERHGMVLMQRWFMRRQLLEHAGLTRFES